MMKAQRISMLAVAALATTTLAVATSPAQSTMGPVDSDPPHLQLSGAWQQSYRRVIVPPSGSERWWLGCDRAYCDVLVGVSCGDEACTARTRGRLTRVEKDKLRGWSVDVDPGRTRKTGVHLRLKTRKQALKALDNGEPVRAKVTVRAKDAAGNVATAKRTIRIVK
jgi:hypothetical protein